MALKQHFIAKKFTKYHCGDKGLEILWVKFGC